MRKVDYFTVVLVAILFIIMVRIVYIIFTEKYTIAAEDIIGLGLLIFGVRLLVTRSVAGEYAILVLILLILEHTLNINFNFADGGYTSQSYVSFGILTFNPFGFLLLIFYLLINRLSILGHIRYLMHGSEDEPKENEQKLFVFYYEKFKNYREDELNNAFGMFKEYPLEAQRALNEIKNERNLL